MSYNSYKTQGRESSVRKLLERLGLEHKEIEIYLSLLPMKIARVSAIAKAAKQPRTLTYVLLQNLEEKGIVSRIEKGNVLHFIAESPRRLLSYAKDKQNEYAEIGALLHGAIPHLENLTSPLAGQPRVTMLHGKDGMKQIYRDVLQEEFISFFNPEAMLKAFQGNIVTMLFGKDAQLRGRDLLVDNAGTKEYLNDIKQHENYTIRLLPKECSFQTDAIVFGATIALFSYDDELSIVRIENQNLANMFRSLFEVLWKQGVPTMT